VPSASPQNDSLGLCGGGGGGVAEQPLDVGEFGLLWGGGETHPSRGTNDFSPLVLPALACCKSCKDTAVLSSVAFLTHIVQAIRQYTTFRNCFIFLHYKEKFNNVAQYVQKPCLSIWF
jgi:hypothetical protein